VSPALAIVIPVLNDEAALASVLAAIAEQTEALAETVEVIVAHGGPSDACREICTGHGITYIESAPGRASQMNTGAALATGDMLLFLHADSRLAPGTVKSLLDQGQSAHWGSFKFRIDADHPALRIIELSANLRAKWFRLPYGDQGIFCRRELFEQVGGYPDTPLLEDVLLARKLSQIERPQQLHGPIFTDARRWLQRGIWKTTWLNCRIMWHFYRGTHTMQELAELYRRRPAG